MQKTSGVLRSLGSSTVSNDLVAYTIIEIGDEVLQKIDIPKPLDNFLRFSLQSVEQTDLYIVGRTILGLKTADGKAYFTNMSARLRNRFLAFALCALVFLFSGLLAFREGGFLFLLLAVGLAHTALKSRMASAQNRIVAEELGRLGGVNIEP
jgi:hypothetical protein